MPSTLPRTTSPTWGLMLLVSWGSTVAAAPSNVVDEQTLRRYKSVPAGYRKHPSYYSERYLSRSQERTDDEWDALAQTWGQWEFDPDEFPSAEHPVNAFYEKYSHRDVPFDQFSDKAWQKDKAYLDKFLPQALDLTERAMEAILSEYGRGKSDNSDLSFEERSEKFRLAVGGKPQLMNVPGGGWMPQESYEGLKRRLLHAVVTQDRFTVAMGGHSAAAGHGNHFVQSYTLQIQRILEPIFARLGVKMSARNFGMGGLGTLQNAVASGDLYGHDVDVLLWDSGMTERDHESRGIFAIQALLSMDRAPLLWFERDKDQVLQKIRNVTGADVGVYGQGKAGGFPQVQSAAELQQLPYALRYFACADDATKPICRDLRYNGTCWMTERNNDFEWQGIDLSYTPTLRQKPAPGGRAGWHPGNLEHQLQGRAFTFPILQALYDVLKIWKAAVVAPTYVLDDSLWHVTDHYSHIKSKVAENHEQWAGWCKARMVPIQFCRYAAQGRTENTPRARPWATSLRTIMAGSEHADMNMGKNLYDPPEVPNAALHPPKGAVDVLAIVENGRSSQFPKNLARVHDSAQDMSGVLFEEFKGKAGKSAAGSKHNPMQIKGGQGWQFEEEKYSAGSDSCDGEHDSWCRRGPGEDCLMYGHNDGRTGLFFDGYSGWLLFDLPAVRHGVIMIKLHTWAFFPPKKTNGWCSENNAEPCPSKKRQDRQLQGRRRRPRAMSSSFHSYPTNSSALMSQSSSQEQRQRELKPKVPEYCDKFQFEYAIDGKITTLNQAEFVAMQRQSQRVVEFFHLLDDDSTFDPEKPRNVELGMRITGCGRQKILDLTHIYWI